MQFYEIKVVQINSNIIRVTSALISSVFSSFCSSATFPILLLYEAPPPYVYPQDYQGS